MAPETASAPPQKQSRLIPILRPAPWIATIVGPC